MSAAQPLTFNEMNRELRQRRAKLLWQVRHARLVEFATYRSVVAIHRDQNGEWRVTRFHVEDGVLIPTGHEFYKTLARAVGAYASCGPLRRIR